MGRLAISCPDSSPFHFNIFGVNPPSHISFFTTSSQCKAPPCINQGSAAWALGLGKNYGRFPLLCTLDKEVSFSCKAMWTYNPSHHFRYCGGSHGFVVPLCLFLSALLSGATPVQGVTDSLILKPQLRVLYQNPSLYKNLRLDAELRFSSHSSFCRAGMHYPLHVCGCVHSGNPSVEADPSCTIAPFLTALETITRCLRPCPFLKASASILLPRELAGLWKEHLPRSPELW